MRLLALAVALAAALVVPAAYAATSRPPARMQVTSSEFDFVLSRTSLKQGRTYRIKTVLPEKFASLTLRLYPGRYTVWCTLGDHRALGMVATFTVRK